MSEERVSYGPSMETVLTELRHRLAAARRHGAVPPGILEMLALIARAVEILDERTREGQRVVYEPKVEPQHVGDGRSKETAIHFTNARTYEEHVALQYQWLRANGLESWMQALAGKEQGWMYDVHHTDQGKIWFRLPDSSQNPA